MRLTPSSWGSPLREYNKCHEPGGKPEGGQFARSEDCGGSGAPVPSRGGGTAPIPGNRLKTKAEHAAADKARWNALHPPATPEPRPLDDATQKKLFPPDQMAKFNDRGAPNPRGFKQEGPKAKDKGAADPSDKVEGYDEDGDVQEVLSALGITMSGEEMAEAMTSRITGETFEVQVSTSDVERDGEADTSDSPDPDDVRSDYDEWQMDQYSEAEQQAWNSEAGNWDDRTEDSFFEVGTNVNAVLGDDRVNLPDGSSRLLDASAWDSDTAGQSDDPATMHTTALAELIYKNTDVITEEGLLQRGWEAKAGEIMLQYVEENPDATFLPFPEDPDGAGGWLRSGDDRRGFSEWFNDNDGFSNWVDDGQNSNVGDDIDSFDTWYENQYGHSPDAYGQSSEVTNGKVEFQFTGSEGSSITRSFYNEDGELHVHHDYFAAGKTGEGVARELFQGSLPLYEQLGVGSISTLANIDVGGYTWARYGFEPENPRSILRMVRSRAASLLKDNGFFTGEDWQTFESVIADGEARALWRVADLKLYEDPARLLQYVDRWKRPSGGYGKRAISNAKFNALLLADAEKGVLNIGRLLLADEIVSWNARLDLRDTDQTDRLRAYAGDWKADARARAAKRQQARQQRQDLDAMDSKRQGGTRDKQGITTGGRTAITDALRRTPSGDRSLAAHAVSQRVKQARKNVMRPVAPGTTSPRVAKILSLNQQRRRGKTPIPGYYGSDFKKLGKRRLEY